MNGLTNALLSQDKNQWNWIRSEDATYKLLDEKTLLSFTGDLHCFFWIILGGPNHYLILKELKLFWLKV